LREQLAMRRLLILALLSVTAPTRGIAQPALSIAAEAQVETVFRWASQRCTELHLPDSPARALRRADGGIALFAAHLVNIPMLGADFDSLSPVCAAMSRGAELADPAMFQDRFWVQAVVPFVDRGRARVLGIASHEFMGWRHPGSCATPYGADGRRPAGFRCWYSAITAVIAEEGDWRFRPIPAPAGVIAASPAPFNPTATQRSGFFSVSNALIEDSHATLMAYNEGIAGQPRGNCLLRAPLNELPGGWRGLSGGSFSETYPGAYASRNPQPRPCDVVGNEVFGGAPIRGVVRVDRPDGPWFVAIFTRAAPLDRRSDSSDGVFLSNSRDLRRWSRAERLWAMTPFRSQPEPGVYYEYPALIDHASSSPVFDTVAATPRLYLYLTRLNLEDRRRGLDRDLIRVAVHLDWP